MKIDVTGLDPWGLLTALYHGSRVSEMFHCLAQERGDITPEIARAECWSALPARPDDVPHYPDYLFGRPIKAFLQKEGDTVYLARTDLYDRDVGEGACARIVENVRGGKQ